MKNCRSRLCTGPFTRPLLVEIAILRLWHGHLTGPRQGYRLQKTSFRILVGIYCHNIPTHTSRSRYHGVTEVAKTANITKMGEKWINCISARHTPPHTNTMESGPGSNSFASKSKKTKRFMIFDPKKGGVIFLPAPPPPTTTPSPHPLPQNLKNVGFKGGGLGGSGPKTHWGMHLLDKTMILQGVKLTIQPLGVGYANRPKRPKRGGGYVAFYRVRDSLRCHSARQLEARRPATFGVLGDGADGPACRAALRAASTELEKSLLRGLLAGAIWTAARVSGHSMRANAACPHCGTAHEDKAHVLWDCPEWDGTRETWLPCLHDAARAIPGLGPPDRWPSCLRKAGLFPLRLAQGVDRDLLDEFLHRLYCMYLAVLVARTAAGAGDQPGHGDSLFPEQPRPRPRNPFPRDAFVGPIPGDATRHQPRLQPGVPSDWRWPQDFIHDLVRWARALTWAPGPAEVSWAELARDYEAFVGRALPASPDHRL